MTFAGYTILIAGVLLLGLIVSSLAERLRLPASAGLMLLGFVGSECLVALGFDTGLRWYNVRDIALYLFIPILIFDLARRLDPSATARFRALLPLFVLPLIVLSVFVAAFALYWMIAHPLNFPLTIAFLSATILAATDPNHVVSPMRRKSSMSHIVGVFEGECAFNDAFAVVLFSFTLSLLLMEVTTFGIAELASGVGLSFIGGVAAGATVGYGLAACCPDGHSLRGLFEIALAYLLYAVCETVFGVSGVLAVFSFGLVASRTKNSVPTMELGALVRVAGILVFVIGGATVTVDLFEDQWLAMLIGIVAALISRSVAILGSAYLWNLSQSTSKRMTIGDQCLLIIGTERGVVALVLALSLPVDIEGWYTIQAIVYGAVLFSVFVQTPVALAMIFQRTRARG